MGVTCELYEYAKKIPNPRWRDLEPEIQEQLNKEDITSIERVYVNVFGKETSRIHVHILGCRAPLVFNKSGRRLS